MLSTESKRPRALYTGWGDPLNTIHALVRHGMYTDKIVVVDPFMTPRFAQNPEYSPIHNPRSYIDSAFKSFYFLLHIYPWVCEGIADIVHNPYHLQPALWKSAADRARERVKGMPDFDKWIESEQSIINNELFDMFRSGAPPDSLIRKLKQERPDYPENELRKYLDRCRVESPYVVGSIDKIGSQIVHSGNGLNYESSTEMCSKYNMYILTDSMTRMQEIHHQVKVDEGIINQWTNIGYAVNKLDASVLDGLNLPAVSRVRDSGVCDGVRKLLSDVWAAVPENNSFSSNMASEFELELKAKMTEAQKEWDSIDTDLLKAAGSEAFIGTGLAVVAGCATILPALAVAGAMGVNLAVAHYKRKDFLRYYPAAAYIEKIRRTII